MKTIIHNGNFISANEQQQNFDNRAFLYGDSFFETIKISNKKLLFWDLHIARIKLAINSMSFANNYNLNNLEREIIDLCSTNKLKNARAKIVFYRNSGGKYTPTNSTCSYIITCEKEYSAKYKINTNGLKIDIFDSMKKSFSIISAVKTNSIIFVLSGIFAQENNIDIAFILNEKNEIIETTSSNIFLYNNGQILTPSVKTGAIDGVMKNYLLKNTKELDLKIKIIDRGFLEKEILEAEEIFITNVINGIHWIANYKDKSYKNQKIRKILAKLNNLLD